MAPSVLIAVEIDLGGGFHVRCSCSEGNMLAPRLGEA